MTCSNPNATESANVTEKLKAHARELEPYVIERRRHFHAYPELSAREVSTSRTIAEELDKLGIEYVRAGGTGLIATIKGTAPDAYDEEGKPAPVALRFEPIWMRCPFWSRRSYPSRRGTKGLCMPVATTVTWQ